MGVSWSPAAAPVLDDASLRVTPGTIHGLIGPAGSGRTAMIRVLLGLVRPDSGWAHINGLDCWDQAVELHRQVSYRPQLALWPQLSGVESLAFAQRLVGDGDVAKCAALLQWAGVDADQPVGRLSGRDRSLMSLMAALCRPVSVYLLDDALADLAVTDIALVSMVLQRERSRGATVLVAGSESDGTAAMCDEVTHIAAGQTSSVASSPGNSRAVG